MLSWLGTKGKEPLTPAGGEDGARGRDRSRFHQPRASLRGPRGHGQICASPSRAPMTALRGRAPVGGDTRDRAFPGARPWSTAATTLVWSELVGDTD